LIADVSDIPRFEQAKTRVRSNAALIGSARHPIGRILTAIDDLLRESKDAGK